MGVWVLPTANSLDVITRVREQIPGIQAQLPTGMKVGIPYDSTEDIHDAINEVLTTLSETLLIVIVVISVPRSLRSYSFRSSPFRFPSLAGRS